ncbi:MAG: transglutaminase domain-containing protein [Thermodesulfobacteriota bacterium]
MRKYTCLLIIFVLLILVSTQYAHSDDEHIPDNPEFKKWCIEAFEYGEYVYEVYKKIAFNVKYTPEQCETDSWKTPLETYKSKEGDCEDVAFLFLNGLALSQRNAGIVWGWVFDKRTGIARAHVWCELMARDGEKYIVEGFCKNWSGIISMKKIDKFEKRIPTFKLSCFEFCRLANSYHGWNILVDCDELFVVDGDYITYGGGNITNDIILHQNPGRNIKTYNKKQVSNILVKLHELFSRIHNGE